MKQYGKPMILWNEQPIEGERAMKHYEKPMILLNEQLAEGVYTASGAAGVSYTLTAGDPGNQWYTTAAYTIRIVNSTSQTVNGWRVVLNVTSQNATGLNVYDGRYAGSLSGNQIILSGQDSLAAGGETQFGFAVNYTGNGVTVR
jgi:hypothetical protein